MLENTSKTTLHNSFEIRRVYKFIRNYGGEQVIIEKAEEQQWTIKTKKINEY